MISALSSIESIYVPVDIPISLINFSLLYTVFHPVYLDLFKTEFFVSFAFLSSARAINDASKASRC